MFKNEYRDALKRWVAARQRCDASEERIGHTFIGMMFGSHFQGQSAPSRPCVNVTPPKPPPKK